MPIYKDIIYIDWTLVFTIVNTLILFFVIKHFLYDKVKKVLNDRQEEVEKIYSDANDANQKASELKETYEMQVSTAREQAGEIVSAAQVRARQKHDEILGEAQAKALDAMTRSKEQIELDRKKAVKEARDEIVDIAVLAASKVINKELDEKSHQQLIEDFIENAGDISWQS